MIFERGDWRIKGSYGSSGSIGTPTLKVQVSGGYMEIPIENTLTGEAAILKCVGAGVSAGVSIELPFTDFVNATISTEEMPSSGIGNIYRQKNGGSKSYKVKDLTGAMTVVTGSAGAAATFGALSMVTWQKYPIAQCVASGFKQCKILQALTNTTLILNPATLSLGFIQATHAVSFMSGIEASTDIGGASANITMYHVTV